LKRNHHGKQTGLRFRISDRSLHETGFCVSHNDPGSGTWGQKRVSKKSERQQELLNSVQLSIWKSRKQFLHISFEISRFLLSQSSCYNWKLSFIEVLQLRLNDAFCWSEYRPIDVRLSGSFTLDLCAFRLWIHIHSNQSWQSAKESSTSQREDNEKMTQNRVNNELSLFSFLSNF
jgi:hypothetical protein